jgi:hypothetical protein
MRVRTGPAVALQVALLAVACGGESTRGGSDGAHAGRGGVGASGGSGSTAANAGGACAEPASVVPDAVPFEPPLGRADVTYAVTFRNDCTQTLWPAWLPGGGLDNTEIDTELWLPIPPGNEHTVTAYGGVREIMFWGRTGCSFDREGRGACETGDCGGFMCRSDSPHSPVSATVYSLFGGFFQGYNVAMRVEGPACGDHECVANVGDCAEASVVMNDCGDAIACNDTCSGSTAPCCRSRNEGCDDLQYPNDIAGESADLVITFCP